MECQGFEGDRTLMRIHIGESDKWHGKLLCEAIIELFCQVGFCGAPVLRGIGGYGSSILPSILRKFRSRRTGLSHA
jgi:hypothetical protein